MAAAYHSHCCFVVVLLLLLLLLVGLPLQLYLMVAVLLFNPWQQFRGLWTNISFYFISFRCV